MRSALVLVAAAFAAIALASEVAAQQPTPCFGGQTTDAAYRLPPQVRCPTSTEMRQVQQLLTDATSARRVGDHARNLELSRQAVSILAATYGSNHPVLGQYYCTLAGIYSWNGDFINARTYFDSGFALTYSTYGQSHPQTGHCIHTGANLYQMLARLSPESSPNRTRYLTEAEQAYGAALRIFEQAQPRSEYELVEATIANHLADTLQQSGRSSEANAMRERARAIERRRLGR